MDRTRGFERNKYEHPGSIRTRNSGPHAWKKAIAVGGRHRPRVILRTALGGEEVPLLLPESRNRFVPASFTTLRLLFSSGIHAANESAHTLLQPRSRGFVFSA